MTKNNRKNIIINIIGLFLIIIFIIMCEKYKSYKVNKYALYTSGTITSYNSTRGGRILNYYFIYKDRKYFGKVSTDFSSEEIKRIIGKNFIVKFDSIKPSWNYLLDDQPLIDNLIVPKNGWKYINKAK